MSIPDQSEAFCLSDTFSAGRELVCRVFTRAAHLRRWWGPTGFTLAVCRFDRRPGGIFHYSMLAPAGHPMGDQAIWGRFVYQELALPERIILRSAFSDEGGGVARHPTRPTWPMQMCSEFTFVEQDGQTTVGLRATPYEATELERNTFAASGALMEKDAVGSFAQLRGYLARLDGSRSLHHREAPGTPALTASLAPRERMQFVWPGCPCWRSAG